MQLCIRCGTNEQYTTPKGHKGKICCECLYYVFVELGVFDEPVRTTKTTVMDSQKEIISTEVCKCWIKSNYRGQHHNLDCPCWLSPFITR